MVIHQIDADAVVSFTRLGLSLPGNSGVNDEAFLAALVRRAASTLCPCSPRTLIKEILEGLAHLSTDSTQLSDEVETAVEKAMIAGDLLELSQVTTDDPRIKGTWVFSAPPAFVVRPSGSIYLFGITPDDVSPLPPTLNTRIEYLRNFRIIKADASENLPQVLLELGLLELSEQSWLKLPKEEVAEIVLDKFEKELMAQTASGDVPELLILDSARNPDYYRGRWVSPKRQTGHFIARRPQAYGAPLWGYAVLYDGKLQKFLDFPIRRDKRRGCDVAWHLQMAIDFCRGSPQKYRRRQTSEEICLDFFSPLPLWAERRLAIIGKPAQRERCLLTYQIPEPELMAEEEFLQKRLWLSPNEFSREGT